MAVTAEFTIDELARGTGTTVRSLRVYHERGILPPPQIKGRTGFYGPQHVDRVHTISRLLERGIKLNGIRELLDALGRGEGLADVLSVTDNQIAPDTESSTEDTVTATDLEAHYRDIPNGLSRVVAAGLYEPVDAATYRVADPMLSRMVDRLVAAGIPGADVLDELDNLRFDADRIARRAVSLIDRTRVTHTHRSNGNSPPAGQLATIPGQVAAELVNRYVASYLEHYAAERRLPA